MAWPPTQCTDAQAQSLIATKIGDTGIVVTAWYRSEKKQRLFFRATCPAGHKLHSLPLRYVSGKEAFACPHCATTGRQCTLTPAQEAMLDRRMRERMAAWAKHGLKPNKADVEQAKDELIVVMRMEGWEEEKPTRQEARWSYPAYVSPTMEI